MTEIEYKRLKGTGRKSSLGYRETFRLWMGQDHLLQISKIYYSEKYKRFYFRDIQGISLEKTKKGFWTNIALSICTLVLLGIGFFIYVKWNEMIPAWIISGLAAPFIFLIIINSLLGPTCRCKLKTAVHLEEIPSLNRLWSAHKTLNQIVSKVQENQGSLASEDIITYESHIFANR